EGGAFYGIPLAEIFPYVITRTWHTQLGIFWIATAWLAAGLYIAPAVSGVEPKGQKLGVNILFIALLVVVLGSMFGEWLSIKHLLPDQLRPIIEKAIAFNPHQRYQDIVDFIAALSEYLESQSLEKDRPEVDKYQELIERIEKTQTSLSPLIAPPWLYANITVAKQHTLESVGLYYDFYKWSESAYLIMLCESTSEYPEALAHICTVRGIVKTLLEEKKSSFGSQFHPIAFIQALNQILATDTLQTETPFCLLSLDAKQKKFSMVNCGLGKLLHLAPEIRQLTAQNPSLSPKTIGGNFFETNDVWNSGDTIILHSLKIPEKDLLKSLKIPRITAESLLENISKQPSFSAQKSPQLIISIHIS
ncbi:hypothetical protein HGB13_03905, partial [bacterium]|nr:hypothetical protein [bacterium]